MKAEPPSLLFNFLTITDTGNLISIAFLLFLLFCTSFVSGSETAFFSLTKKELDEERSSHPEIVEQISKLLREKKSLLSTILILSNLFNIGIVLLTSLVISSLHISSDITILDRQIHFTEANIKFIKLLFDMVVITLTILIFGEIIPKIYAKRNPFTFASKTVTIIGFAQQLLSPISYPLSKLTIFIEKIIGKENSFSVNQLTQALELASEDKSTTEEEQKILEGIINFGNTVTKQVMTPRVDMFAIQKDTPFVKVVEKIRENGFSRIPIYEKNEDDIVGVLYAKDLIQHLKKEEYHWQKNLRKPYFVPENKKLDDLLADFQEKKTHLAIVVDEYGGTSGIVTMEDVIEEIVGDISDEFDDDEITYSKIDEDTFLIEGKTALKDFYRIMEIEEDEEFEQVKGESDTLAGFILEITDDFPKRLQKIKFINYEFTIEALDKKRIKRIKVKRILPISE